MTDGGMTLDERSGPCSTGYGMAPRAADHDRLIITAIRQAAKSVEIAELAVRHRDAGVVAFDIAGPEPALRPTRHLDAFDLIAHENFHFTIHAARASACRRSGRRSDGAAPSASATACASSTTSRYGPIAAWRSRGSRTTFATRGNRLRCGRHRTSIRAPANIKEHPIDLLAGALPGPREHNNRLMSSIT